MPTYTKTTGIRGRHEVDWESDLILGTGRPVGLGDVLPPEAAVRVEGRRLPRPGVAGTFRIVVEFTPDEPKET